MCPSSLTPALITNHNIRMWSVRNSIFLVKKDDISIFFRKFAPEIILDMLMIFRHLKVYIPQNHTASAQLVNNSKWQMKRMQTSERKFQLFHLFFCSQVLSFSPAPFFFNK